MKIYTKTGDKGKSGLIGGTRVEKSDMRLEAYGTVDELNTQIGLLISLDVKEEHLCFLQKVQNLLFTVGSNLATDTSKMEYKAASTMREEYVEEIEREIDNLEMNLPPLKHFILPGGSQKAAVSHICRTTARRAERRIVTMSAHFPVDELTLKYINRLSDYFFVLARVLLMDDSKKEIIWEQPI